MFHRSVDINSRFGDDGQAATLHELGRIAQERRQFNEAERLYRQSLDIASRLGNEDGQARNLHQLGKIAALQGKANEAEQFYSRAEAIFLRLNDLDNLAIARD